MPKHRHRQSPTASALAVATAAVLAVLLAVPFALGQTAARYAEPNFEAQLFAREALLLETQEIASAVSALVALAANFPSDPAINHQLRAMALGIALRLDGTHPGALATNASLKKAELPTPLSDYETLGEVAGQLWITASYLESPEMGEDERVLQFCLVDIARNIDPTNLADSNRYPARLPESVFPGWDTVVGNSSSPAFVFPGREGDPPVAPDQNPDPDGATDPPAGDGGAPPIIPANATRTADGSYRSLTASGSTPAITKIGGDLKTSGGTSPLAIIFSDENGDTGQPLNDNRGSLVSALTQLHGSWRKDGGVVVLTVSNVDAGDGALLLPSAILADSLIRERPLAAGTIAAGFVDPDGGLLGVEQLHKRLAAFKANDVDTILLPEENLRDLQDLALLGELAPFFRYQIILVSDLEQATVLAAEARGEDFETNLRAFKLVQEVAKNAVLTKLTGFTAVKSTFEKITKLNPQHASAAVLLAHGAGELPEHLSRNGSLNALSRATGPVVKAMLSQGSADQATVVAAYESVDKIQPILDPEIAALGETMSALLKDIGTFAAMEPKTSQPANELKDKIFSTWETVREEFGRLKNSGG